MVLGDEDPLQLTQVRPCPPKDQVHVVSQFESSWRRLTAEKPIIYGEAKCRLRPHSYRSDTPGPLGTLKGVNHCYARSEPFLRLGIASEPILSRACVLEVCRRLPRWKTFVARRNLRQRSCLTQIHHAGRTSRKDCKQRRAVSSSENRLPSCSIR